MSGGIVGDGDGTWSSLITEAELEADLKALEVEAIGWLPLTTEESDSAYLHVGDPEALVIEVVGAIWSNRFQIGSLNSKERHQ